MTLHTCQTRDRTNHAIIHLVPAPRRCQYKAVIMATGSCRAVMYKYSIEPVCDRRLIHFGHKRTKIKLQRKVEMTIEFVADCTSNVAFQLYCKHVWWSVNHKSLVRSNFLLTTDNNIRHFGFSTLYIHDQFHTAIMTSTF